MSNKNNKIIEKLTAFINADPISQIMKKNDLLESIENEKMENKKDEGET